MLMVTLLRAFQNSQLSMPSYDLLYVVHRVMHFCDCGRINPNGFPNRPTSCMQMKGPWEIGPRPARPLRAPEVGHVVRAARALAPHLPAGPLPPGSRAGLLRGRACAVLPAAAGMRLCGWPGS